METEYLMSKAISSALNRRKNFHPSHVFFELSDFEDDATGKSKKDEVLKNSKFLTLYFFQTKFFGFFLMVC